MKAKQIEKGCKYWAKVSGRIVPVRVLDIYSQWDTFRDCSTIRYKVRNEKTGRIVTFRSAQKFRAEVVSKASTVSSNGE